MLNVIKKIFGDKHEKNLKELWPVVPEINEEYEKLKEGFPEIDFSKLYRYEEEDYTKAAQELACVSGCDFDPNEGRVKN